MKAFLICYLVVNLFCSQTFGQTRKKQKSTTQKTETATPDWRYNGFCSDSDRCNAEALWTEPGGGTILLTWKGNTLTISVTYKGDEQIVVLGETGAHQHFRKEVTIVCETCPLFRDGTKVTYQEWQFVAPAQGKDLVYYPWVQQAIKKYIEKKTRLQKLAPPPTVAASTSH